MTHADLAVPNQFLDFRAQLQQADQVGDGRACPPDPLGNLFVGLAQTIRQSAQGPGFVDRVEVFPLDVLDQGHRRRFVVGQITDNGGQGFKSGRTGRAQPAFPRHQFVLPLDPAHQDRLDRATLLQRGGQGFDHLIVEPCPRLVRAGPKAIQRDVLKIRIASAFDRLGPGAQESLHSGAEAAFLRCVHVAVSKVARSRRRISPASIRYATAPRLEGS